MRIGIIGAGGFGRLAARVLAESFEVIVTDVLTEPKDLGKARFGSLEEFTNCDIVILAVNLEHLQGVLVDIMPHLKPGTLVVDVCSVKMKPIEMMERLLPSYIDILGTHPLFGPQSAKNGLSGHKIVLYPHRISSERLQDIKEFLYSLGLKIDEKNPEEHDLEMATVQGLTHFVARALKACGVKHSSLGTVAFAHMCQIMDNLSMDSFELFCTIENGNPFAEEMRQKFMKALNELEEKLKDNKG